MFEHLQDLEKKHDELYRKLVDPDVLADQALYRETNQRLAEIKATVELYRRWRKALAERDDTREMLAGLGRDDELRAVAEEELERLESTTADLEEKLRTELEPRDPNDERNVVLEIRAGTGGDEASLFAAELFRMYSRYAERRGYRVSILDVSESGVRGIKEISAIVEGRGAWSRLKYEGGVHRVQRVPETEASGRIHTSAVTVAVLPEAEDVEVELDEKDLRVDRFCASGPGGQGVNTTYSAVRLTHLPTGIVVSCQDERSQIKNKATALRVLKSRLYEIEQQKAIDEQSEKRRKMIGSGDRSEKIRTYNFPQSRVTDHRAGVTLHQLPSILDGELDGLIDAVHEHFQAEELAPTT
ncbi:MAG TPA: peptide chain release factor 1 [Thermoanaerobaculia bacterium]|nr:peptide chain release factor 1 [Thermoanaerobaculia bacterium]